MATDGAISAEVENPPEDEVQKPALHVLHLFPCLYLGGAEHNTLRLMQALSPRHAFSLVAPDGPGAPLFEDAGLTRRSFRRLELDVLSGFASVRRALQEEISRSPVDLVHVHVEAGLLWIVRAMFPQLPLVYTCHGIVGGEALKYRLTALAINRWADFGCAVSEHDRALMLRYGARADKLRLVLNGVDAPVSSVSGQEALAKAMGAGEDTLMVGTLARLEPEKGVDVLIRAVASLKDSLPGLRLAVAGEGGQEKRLRALIESLGCEGRVQLMGFVQDAGDFLANLDIYVQPSRKEAFGLGLTEAMAMGLPAIGARVGGIPEQIVEGETGLLVPPADPEALAAALAQLAADATLRQTMGQAAMVRHGKEFSLQQMAQRMERVYREALCVQT